MRARNIKPGFYDNELLGTISPMAHLLFPFLWMECDHEGKMEYRPLKIKAKAFPYRDADVSKLCDELEEIGMISRYSRDGGQHKYLIVHNFTKHQGPCKKEREKPSVIPDYIQERSQNGTGMVPERSDYHSGSADIPHTDMPHTDIPPTEIPSKDGPVGRASEKKNKPLDPKIEQIISVYNETARLMKWIPFTHSYKATRLNAILKNRTEDDQWMADLQRYAHKMQRYDWTEGWNIENFLRPMNMKKCFEGYWDRDNGKVAPPKPQEELDLSKPWNRPVEQLA